MKKIYALIALILIANADVIAQGCSTCTATANNLDASSAKGLNYGIVYLALIPLIFMVTMGIIWYRRSRSNV